MRGCARAFHPAAERLLGSAVVITTGEDHVRNGGCGQTRAVGRGSIRVSIYMLAATITIYSTPREDASPPDVEISWSRGI